MIKIRNVINLTRTFFVYLNEFSLKIAISKIMLDVPIGSWENKKKYYDNTISNYLKKYIKNDINVKYELAKSIIWVMWWQGEDSMPPIVKACWLQLNKISKNEIVLITKDNWNQYVSIPNYIISKIESGSISLTHFSDIIRMCLLEKYGGLWLDATLWCEEIPNDIFNKDIYTLHAPGMFPCFVSNGNYSTFCLGTTQKDRRYFTHVKTCLFNYWKEHNIIIDYLLIDYFMNLCFLCDLNAKDLISQLEINDGYYLLNQEINEVYTNESFNKIMQRSLLQKLTYKKNLKIQNANGELTNYGYILESSGVFNET